MMATSFLEYLKHRGQLHVATVGDGLQRHHCRWVVSRVRNPLYNPFMDDARLMAALQRFLGPDVEQVCITKLRLLNKKALREMRRPMILQTEGKKPFTMEPLAVVVRYDVYLEMQKVIWGAE